MPQQHVHDDPYVLGPVLDARLDLIKEWLDERFTDMRQDIARVEHQMDGLDVHVREHCRLIEVQLGQHEKRIKAQEQQSIWRWGATVLSAFLALLGIRSPQ